MGAEASVGSGPMSVGCRGIFACLDGPLDASMRLRRARRAAFSFSRALKRAEICSSMAANAGHDNAEAASPIHNTTASFVNLFIVPPLQEAGSRRTHKFPAWQISTTRLPTERPECVIRARETLRPLLRT